MAFPETRGRLDYILEFIKTHSVPEESLRHFAFIPWTNKHLSNSAYRAIPTYYRVLKPDNSDCFFARTVSNPSTIPHVVTLQRKDFHSLPESPKGSLKLSLEQRQAPFPAPENPDCITLMELGPAGLDGHYGVIHGGMASAILDELIGLTVTLHLAPFATPGLVGFTASLNVTYRAPVPTPSTVVVHCWIEAHEGRKWVCRGQIVDKVGLVLTEAEALLVTLPNRPNL